MANYASIEFLTSPSPKPTANAFTTMTSSFQRSETSIPSSSFKRMGGFTKPSEGTDFQRMELFSDKNNHELPKVELPKVELPNAELPKVELPQVDLPKNELVDDLQKVESNVSETHSELPKDEVVSDLQQVESNVSETTTDDLPPLDLIQELPKVETENFDLLKA